jgi:hypothetical protein
MKKVSLLSIIIVMLFIVFSCGFKDKLMNNAISVTIKPGIVDFIWFNSLQEFTASIRDPGGKLMDVTPHWSISGFSQDVSISTNIGKSIVFCTGNTESRGVLTAEYDGVRCFVNIEISNRFNLYKNSKLSNKIDEENLIYVEGGGTPSDYITLNSVQDEDGEKCFELIIKQPQTGCPVGFCLEFKIPEDLSKFTTLHFSMRSCDGKGDIKFDYYTIDDYKSSEGVSEPSVGGSFSDIPIDISDVSQRNSTKEVLSIEFGENDINPSPRKVRLKNIYLE